MIVMNRMKQIKKPVLVCLILGLFGLLLVCRMQVQAGAAYGLRLFGTVLVPSLFPFAVLAQMAAMLPADLPGKPVRPFLSISPSGWTVLLLGWLGGYPIGAQLLSAQAACGRRSREEALRLSLICSNAGPAFVIGTVGGALLGQWRSGVALWIIHLTASGLAAAVVGRFLPIKQKDFPSSVSTALPGSSLFPEAVRAAVQGMLQVGGTVVFFSVLLEVLHPFAQALGLPLWLRALCGGLLELSNGVFLTRGLAPDVQWILLSAMTGFGGLCVQAQLAAFLAGAQLPILPGLLSKLLQGVFAAGLTAAIVHIGTGSGVVWIGLVSGLMFFLFFGKKDWKMRKLVVK